MIPDDYITVPTALKHVRDRIDEDDLSVIQGKTPEEGARQSLEEKIRDSKYVGVHLFVMQGGKAVEISNEDAKQLIASGGWDEAGRVISSAPKYAGCRLLIQRYQLGSWLPPLPGDDDGWGWVPPKESEMRMYQRQVLPAGHR